MKTLNIFLEDKEHEDLVREKGSMSWHDFLVGKINNQKENETNDKRM